MTPILAKKPQHQVSGRSVTRLPIFKSLMWVAFNSRNPHSGTYLPQKATACYGDYIVKLFWKNKDLHLSFLRSQASIFMSVQHTAAQLSWSSNLSWTPDNRLITFYLSYTKTWLSEPSLHKHSIYYVWLLIAKRSSKIQSRNLQRFSMPPR